jgi:uncharacterized protein YndB with AHSA1/START domain
MTAIEVDEFLPHPPARVWRALTDPDRLARWLMDNDFAPVVGHRFTFRTKPVPASGFDGVIHCEVLEVTSEKLLVYRWRANPLNTTVTWRLVAEGTGTRLFLTHTGFDPDDPVQRRTFAILDGGWRSHVFRSLATELAGAG